jgi:hypothetical protein
MGKVGGVKKVVVPFGEVFQKMHPKPFLHLFEATNYISFPIHSPLFGKFFPSYIWVCISLLGHQKLQNAIHDSEVFLPIILNNFL